MACWKRFDRTFDRKSIVFRKEIRLSKSYFEVIMVCIGVFIVSYLYRNNIISLPTVIYCKKLVVVKE